MTVPESYKGPVYIARCRGCESLHEVTKWAAKAYVDHGYCRCICRTCGKHNNKEKMDIAFRPEDPVSIV